MPEMNMFNREPATVVFTLLLIGHSPSKRRYDAMMADNHSDTSNTIQ